MPADATPSAKPYPRPLHFAYPPPIPPGHEGRAREASLVRQAGAGRGYRLTQSFLPRLAGLRHGESPGTDENG